MTFVFDLIDIFWFFDKFGDVILQILNAIERLFQKDQEQTTEPTE